MQQRRPQPDQRGDGPPPACGPGGPSRTAAEPFAHNDRAALALLPPALVLLVAGGPTLVGVCCFGCLVTYALDLLGWREAALASMCGTLFSLGGGQLIASLFLFGFGPLGLAVAAQAGLVCTLLGAWGSLNFRSLSRQYPVEMGLLERALFAAGPFGGAPVLGWAALCIDEPGRAAYHLGVAFACLHLLLGGSVRASLGGGSGVRGRPACPRAAAALQSVACLLLPALFQWLLQRHSAAGLLGSGLLDVAAAVALPAAILSARAPAEVFWWLLPDVPTPPSDAPAAAAKPRGHWRARLACICARAYAAAIVGCFVHSRVLLGSLRHYMAVGPPLDGPLALVVVGCALAPSVLSPLLGKRATGLSHVLHAASAGALSALLGLHPALCLLPATGALAASHAVIIILIVMIKIITIISINNKSKIKNYTQ
ncbi:hypothetical protein T492DRAFT_848481 [Pavlovales sp. CCMP2436]|nr:hypothetical protein T492DRAFT_848481 [Pavlovales sp. CCMP2436]